MDCRRRRAFKKRRRSVGRARGQATVEYLLVLAVGAVIAFKLASFFVGSQGVLTEGLRGLEVNVRNESQSGSAFGP